MFSSATNIKFQKHLQNSDNQTNPILTHQKQNVIRIVFTALQTGF